MAKRSIKRTRRLIALLACIALAIALLPVTASAEDGPDAGMPLAASAPGATRGASGSCGDNLTWELDDSGTLTISGTGEMSNDWGDGGAPWDSKSDYIKKVVIGDGVTSIGGNAFFMCTRLKSVTFGDGSRLATIGGSAFFGCNELESIEIPGGVTSIGDQAFGCCSGLTRVTIPDGVESIGGYAFLNCNKLESIEIPSSVTSIGACAFLGCTSLESVEIPGSVTSIGDEAFGRCNSLADVYFFGAEQQWRAAVGDNGVVPGSTTVHFVDGKCGDSAYWALDGEGTLTISGTGAINNRAFAYRDDIKSVVIEDGVTSIGYMTFRECENLEKAVIPGSVKTIVQQAFFCCSKLEELTIRPGVQSIGDAAFHSCTSLASVEIPDSVESIGGQAFELDRYLAKVTIGKSEQKPCSVKSIGYEAFREIGPVNSPKTITINTYESHVTEKGDRWCDGPGINVVWLWALVTAAADSSAGGTVTVGGGVPTDDGTAFRKDASATATLKAVPNDGYAFANWTDEDGKVITDGSGNAVGASYAFTVTADRALTANFKPALTITAKDQTYTYDGSTQGEGDPVIEDNIDSKITAEGLQSGDKIAMIVIDGAKKDVGENDIVVTGCQVKNANNEDVTENYDITFLKGTLTINPKTVTVTTGSADKVYDGTPLTNSKASIAGLVKGENATVTATGSQTEVGSSPNTYSIKWGNVDANNYIVTEKLGTLTVEAEEKATLTFDLAGGTLDGKTGKITIEANVGDTVKLPGAPTRDGYAFKFWKGSEYAAGAEYKVEGDHAFAAEWVAVHTVAFDANGHGKAPDAQTVEHGGKAKKPANPTASGYTFGGWYTDKACKEAYDFSKPVTEDVTLYAKWTGDAVVKHKVTFDANGHGTAPDAQEVEHGKKAKRPVSPTANGYTFGGWYTDKACKSAYDFSTPVTSDITLYAKWTAKSSSKSSTSPKTGDPLAGALAIALALAAASALALAVSRRMRRG